VFGEANFRNQRVQFGIKTDDRRRHMYVIGKTGMGKSHLLRNLAYNDVHTGKGLAFIDPHGDSADWLLEHIPKERINDVVYINPTDIDYPVAFNVLEKTDRRFHNLVADGLVGIFKKIWADSWGPRLEYLLRNALLALLDFQDSTLLGVTRMMVDKSYRKKVIKQIQDPVVKAFWVDEFSRYNDRFLVEAIAPIQNKVGQFLANAVIRNIVGQTKSTINMREIMDNGKILILNLSKGKIGEESSALLGAMIVTKLSLAAMSRADIPEEERRDFFLYVDEFQTFATESFADVLSEARKYRLSLTMAHQYVEQMPESVANAVFGNVGTIVTFRVGAMDAEMLEKEFEPIFMQQDLVNLPKFHFYIKLMIDGVAGEGFSANTINMQFEPTGNMDKVVRVSRERYANPRKDVEDKIARWSGVFDADDIPDEEKPKPKFEYIPKFKPKGGGKPHRKSDGGNRRPPKRNQPSRPGGDRSRNFPNKNRAEQGSVSKRSSNERKVSKNNLGKPDAASKGSNIKKAEKPKADSRPQGWQPPPPPPIPRGRTNPKDSQKGISMKEAVSKKPQSAHIKKSEHGSGPNQSLKPGQKVSIG